MTLATMALPLPMTTRITIRIQMAAITIQIRMGARITTTATVHLPTIHQVARSEELS